jgi:hypothetical protein
MNVYWPSRANFVASYVTGSAFDGYCLSVNTPDGVACKTVEVILVIFQRAVTIFDNILWRVQVNAVERTAVYYESDRDRFRKLL